ncbi:hypothetical protein IQ252_25535 [Tychonema sp. LEGE 07203]|nr:hypothetical protein [Tychonema sp. LEGE 07203]
MLPFNRRLLTNSRSAETIALLESVNLCHKANPGFRLESARRQTRESPRRVQCLLILVDRASGGTHPYH